MSNKAMCPACNAYLSSVWAAFNDGEPCPNCGLPADAAAAFDAARRRGANEGLIEQAAEATARAARAEDRVCQLESWLQEIRWIVDRKADDD